MKKTLLVSLFFSLIVMLVAVNDARSSERPIYVPGEVLVKFGGVIPIHRIDALKTELGL